MATDKLLYSSKDDVSSPMMAYTNSRNAILLPDCLLGGTEAMRKAGVLYLPKEDGESEIKYQARLDRSVLLEAYSRTIEKMVGEMFKDSVSISEDVDEDVRDWLNDIDRRGNDITSFMIKVASNGMHEGIAHVLVDYPLSPGKTVADHKESGAYPYLVHVKPDSVIGWRHDANQKLSQLRVKETHSLDDGLYGTKDVDRIRLLQKGSWEVHESNGGAWDIAYDDGVELSGKTSLDIIPIVTIWFGEEVTEMTAKPPLLPLAHLNCSHWQSSSDQRNILHYARMVTFFGKMIAEDEDGKVLFGANRLLRSDSPDGDLKVVEHSGAAIGAGRQDLEDLKTEMSMFGLSLMIGKTGTVTATEKGIDKGENDSALFRWVRNVNSALEQIFEYMHRYLGREVKGEIKVNDDFSNIIGTQDAALLVQCYEAGILPRNVVIEELKSRGIIKSEIDLVDLVAQLEEDRKTQTVTVGTAGPFSSTPLQTLQ